MSGGVVTAAGQLQRRVFRAMGTDIELLVESDDAERELDAAEGEFHRLEALLSRFRPESELSRLNRDGRIVASPDTARVIALALDARERTEGRFDPAVLDAVEAAGYDRSFELMDVDGDGDVHRHRRRGRSTPRGPGQVRIDGLLIELEPGVRLDLGGIGKGYAADRAADVLALAGPCLVNAGGDIAVRGGSWPVGVAEGVTLELTSGAIATSGRDRRRWRRDGRELHHLIDPSTGEPADTDLLRVTAVAADAAEAEVLAKWLFLAGEAGAAASGAPCVLVTEDGRVRLVGGLA
jgi:FAD:protein FMN transferase